MKIIVPLAEGFEEIEFSTIVDILRRAEIEVIVAGLKKGLIQGARKVKVMPDTFIDRINSDDFDVIVLPGGYPGFENLGKDKRVLNLIQKMDREGKYITAICGAPSVLSRAGILKGKKATIYPGIKDKLQDSQYIDERVIVDGKIVTSQGPGTAMEFALKLVEILAGEDKMKKVKAEALVI